MSTVKTMTEAKIGTTNFRSIGTRFWVEPSYPMMEAIFGSPPSHTKDMVEWCRKTFDESQWDIFPQNRYRFKNKEDRTLFMLRWS
jgi:hypothetical protein